MNIEELAALRVKAENEFNSLEKKRTDASEEMLRLQGEYRILTHLVEAIDQQNIAKESTDGSQSISVEGDVSEAQVIQVKGA